jgi:glycosyltransferase involved in cell wall biosynthesis
VLKRADYVTACSDYLLRDAISRVPEIKNKSRVIYNGLDLEEFNNQDRYRHNRAYIFSLGRLSPEKGFDILLISFKDIIDKGYDVDLIICGEGPFEDDLMRFRDILHLKDRFIFFGPANRKQTVELFNGCEFFVLPSRLEPMGIVNLEAMAAGKAIVAADSGGVPEIVKDGYNGILVKPKDAQSLSAAMIKLLDNKELRDRLARNGREFVKQFDWKKISDMYLDTYRSL